MGEDRNQYGIPTMPSRLDTLTHEMYRLYRDLAWLHRQAATELPVGYQRLTHEARAAYLEAISADYKGG
jgi:hypothetical protein